MEPNYPQTIPTYNSLNIWVQILNVSVNRFIKKKKKKNVEKELLQLPFFFVVVVVC